MSPISTSNPLDLERQIKQRGPAPVHLWNPPFCGDIGIHIRADGKWFHDGRPIRRPALIKLFANVLKKEGDEHFLVTPVEKLRIRVDDCAFIAVLLDIQGQGEAAKLEFTLNTGDKLFADAGHPITVGVDPHTGEPHPVLDVRNGLQALIGRNVFYQLVENAQTRELDGETLTGVWSQGKFFELGRLRNTE
jgi:uncharacterized protein